MRRGPRRGGAAGGERSLAAAFGAGRAGGGLGCRLSGGAGVGVRVCPLDTERLLTWELVFSAGLTEKPAGLPSWLRRKRAW